MLLKIILFGVLFFLSKDVSCEVDAGIQSQLLNGFVDGLNNLPVKVYTYDDGLIIDAQKEEEGLYKIQAKVRATDLKNEEHKYLQCSATLQLNVNESVHTSSHHCDDFVTQSGEELATQSNVVNEHKPLQLDNEVSTDTAVTSGEQFVAVPKNHCMGCSSHVDVDAPGVSDLAELAVRHIHLHQPDVEHRLNHVIDVERQVQTQQSGVRYILKLDVEYKNNSKVSGDDVADNEMNPALQYNKICSVTILDKPWVKLPNGSKYRAILVNNCTDIWLFGDDGEVISGSEINDENQSNGEIKPIHIEGLSSNPKTERTLTVDELKALQEQIIPHNSITPTEDAPKIVVSLQEGSDPNQNNVQELQSATYYSSSETANNIEPSNISNDKKKSIDELMSIFEFSGFEPNNVNIKLNSQQRDKRQFSGVSSAGNPNDPEYKALAEECLSKYVATSGNGGGFRVISVDQVSVQFGSGQLTKLTFTIGSGQQVAKCNSEAWERPWLKEKEIKIQCDLGSKLRSKRSGNHPALGAPDAKNQKKTGFSGFEPNNVNIKLNSQQRDKRQFSGVSSAGNPNDPEYKALAEECLSKYVATSGNGGGFRVISVDQVSVQFGSGQLTKLTFTIGSGQQVAKCNSEAWERPWLKEKEIKIQCDLGSKLRSKRSGNHPALGAPDAKNPNDPKYKALAEECLSKYVATSGNGGGFRVISVDQVSEQVVSGQLTKLTFTIGSGQQVAKCNSEVWERPWLNNTEITVTCDLNLQHRSKWSSTQLIGGLTEQDPKKNEFRLLAEKSLEKFVATSGVQELYKVMNIEKVTTQLVAGFLTNLDFSIGLSDNSVAAKCHSRVLEQTWLNNTEITVTCDLNSQHRTKKLIPGATAVKNPNDPKYKEMAEESFEKFVATSGNVGGFRVISVDQVSEQVVSGQLTKLTFTIGSGQQVAKCDSEVWEQPWLKKKEIKIQCDLGSKLRSKRSTLDSEKATVLAVEALKHIEAKYPHPYKQAIVKILSATQEKVAGKHYRLKLEVGVTNCTALSAQENCQLETNSETRLNKFCKVNLWRKSNTEHPPSTRVSCDDQSANSSDVYHHIQAERLFYNFLATHQPSYVDDQAEMFKRFNIFKDNVRKIHDFNIYERGTARYAVTRFADLTYEEFRQKHLGLKPSLRSSNFVPMRKAVIPDAEIPDHFDWRDKGAVTEVKNQGSCGSCWAFSVTGNIEGQWKLRSGKLVSLSEQELVDCDSLDHGCNGGLPDNAYRAIEQLGGLETEADYPYDGSNDKCAFNRTLSRVQINGAVNISSDENDMAKWLVTNGPISIGINANAMQFYMGGVSHPWKVLCNASNLDHGVLIVGYGVKDYPIFKKRLPYWTIKNSWGPRWGEQGYYRVFRGDGTCGVNQMASSAVIN